MGAGDCVKGGGLLTLARRHTRMEAAALDSCLLSYRRVKSHWSHVLWEVPSEHQRGAQKEAVDGGPRPRKALGGGDARRL